ncbi:transcriptional regulator, partial [Pseudomonas frederiksbergensis]|nr:transcriptional regulator [Pseudomonas frederiksbergensis]
SAVRRGYQDILVFTGSTRFSNENEFAEAFKQMVKVGGDCTVTHISTDAGRISHTVLTALIGERKVDAVFTTNIGFADKIRQIRNSF